MSTPYQELVIEGPRGWAMGFIEGFARGRGLVGRILEAEEEGFDCEPFIEKIRELLTRSSERIHLLVPDEACQAVREAVEVAQARGHRLKVVEKRPVQGARFSFVFAAYSREHADKIRSLFDELPEGVSLSADSSFDEEIDPSAKGVEAYAPAHDYTLRGKGTVEGPIEGIVTLHRACSDMELIQEQKIELIPGDEEETESADE